MDSRTSYYTQKSLGCKNPIPYYGVDPQITTCNSNGRIIENGPCNTKEYFIPPSERTTPPRCNQWDIYNQKECHGKW